MSHHQLTCTPRDVFAGYSLATLPTTPGCHTFSCPVWVATEGRSSISKELTSECLAGCVCPHALCVPP
jgi:hypothetical protein